MEGRAARRGAGSGRRRARESRITGTGEDVGIHHSSEVLIGSVDFDAVNKIASKMTPMTLLESQLATLEPLESDEAGVVVDIAAPVNQVVTDAPAGIAAAKETAEAAAGDAAGRVSAGAAGTQPGQFDVDLKAAPFNLDDAAVEWP